MVDRSDIEAHRQPPRRLAAYLLALYPLAWVALFAGSNLYWFLPAGLRLGTLWMLPRKHWWKMAVLEWAAVLGVSLARGRLESTAALVAWTLLPWCLYALVLRGIGRHGRDTPAREALPRLLVVGIVAHSSTAIFHHDWRGSIHSMPSRRPAGRNQ